MKEYEELLTKSGEKMLQKSISNIQMVILSESGEDLSVSKLATIDEAAFYEGQVTDYLTFVCYLMNKYPTLC